MARKELEPEKLSVGSEYDIKSFVSGESTRAKITRRYTLNNIEIVDYVLRTLSWFSSTHKWGYIEYSVGAEKFRQHIIHDLGDE